METCAFGNTSLNFFIMPDMMVKAISEGKPNDTSTTALLVMLFISSTMFFISRVMDSDHESIT